MDRTRVAELSRLLAKSLAIIEALEPAAARPCRDAERAFEQHRDARLVLERQLYDRSDLASNIYSYAFRADVRAAVDGAAYVRRYTAVAERIWSQLVRNCAGSMNIEALGFGTAGSAVRRPLLGGALWPRPFVNGRDDREVVAALQRFDRVWGAFVDTVAQQDCAGIAQRMLELRAKHAPLIRATIELRTITTDVQEQQLEDDTVDRGLDWYRIAEPCEEDPAYLEAERTLFAR